MKFLHFVRRLFAKKTQERRYEYVKEYAPECGQSAGGDSADQVPGVGLKAARSPAVVPEEPIIAFSHQGDLQAYVEGLNVSSEVIEGWISAGLLLPEETRVAMQMIRLMQQKRKPGAP